MILYISDLQNSTRKFLQLIKPVSIVVGYKINSNKSVAFLYTNDKWAEKNIWKTIPYTKVSNNIKYLMVTITKQVKDLCVINIKSLKKEIQEDIRRRKDLSGSGPV